MSLVTILGHSWSLGMEPPLGYQCSGGSALDFWRLNLGQYGIGGFDTERNLRSGLFAEQRLRKDIKNGLQHRESETSAKRLARECACGLLSGEVPRWSRRLEIRATVKRGKALG